MSHDYDDMDGVYSGSQFNTTSLRKSMPNTLNAQISSEAHIVLMPAATADVPFPKLGSCMIGTRRVRITHTLRASVDIAGEAVMVPAALPDTSEKAPVR